MSGDGGGGAENADGHGLCRACVLSGVLVVNVIYYYVVRFSVFDY